jgi:hypothetical protein
MTTYNIEVAHIYGDGKFSPEHTQGLTHAREIIDRLGPDKCTVVVMVDDIHAPMNLDIDAFVDRIALDGVFVDHVYLESQMREGANYLRNILFSEIGWTRQKFNNRDQIGFMENGEWIGVCENDKATCALLSAAFLRHRCNQPRDHYSINQIYHPAYSTKPVSCDEMIAILPKKFMNVERKVQTILIRANLQEIISRAQYIFF